MLMVKIYRNIIQNNNVSNATKITLFLVPSEKINMRLKGVQFLIPTYLEIKISYIIILTLV